MSGWIGLALQLVNGPVGTAVEKYFDNAKDAEAFKNAVQIEVLKNQKNIEDQAGAIVLAEAQSESWITSSWRPLTMAIFVSLIAISLLIVPYMINPILWAIGYPVIEAPHIPDQIWTLMTIGLGGYVGGRSIEKAASNVAKAMKPKPRLDDF